MVDLIKYSVSLAAVACLAVLPVSIIHDKTSRKAADASGAMQEAAVRHLVPGNSSLVEKRVLLQDEKESSICWMSVAERDTTIVFTVDIRRYPGTIGFVVGIGTDGAIRGMHPVGSGGAFCFGDMRNFAAPVSAGGVKKKKEMPTDPWFEAQFIGLSTNRPIVVDRISGEWRTLDAGARKMLLERNGVTAVTGATISTRAVADAVASRAKLILKAVRS